jgi:hypothetical protein
MNPQNHKSLCQDRRVSAAVTRTKHANTASRRIATVDLLFCQFEGIQIFIAFLTHDALVGNGRDANQKKPGPTQVGAKAQEALLVIFNGELSARKFVVAIGDLFVEGNSVSVHLFPEI